MHSNPPQKNEYGRINTINIISSVDLVKLSDYGTINEADSNDAAKWATNPWSLTTAQKMINGKK